MLRLTKYYLLIGIPWIIISIIGVTWMYRLVAFDDLKKLTQENTLTLTKTVANVIWPQIGNIVAVTVNHPGVEVHDHDAHNRHTLSMLSTMLDEAIGDLIRGTSVLKIKIFNTNGLTVYSTDPSQIGERMPPDYPGNVARKKNEIISQLHLKTQMLTWQGKTVSDRYVVSTYLPLRYFDNYEVEGVFEIYNDVTDVYNQINASQRKFATVLSIGLATVYVFLFIFIRYADKTIKKNIELAVARDSERHANKTKSLFLANMSHELRTPLNAIIGYSELLEEAAREKDDTDSVEDTLKIQSAARHLLHLINEILDLSKVEAGKLKVFLEEISVDGFVKEVKNLVDPVIIKNNNFLSIVVEPGLEHITTDAIKLKQILFNLLGNAAKFTLNGVIEFMLHTEGAWLVITISDCGIGISQEQLARLFQPFTQADSSTTRKYGGTGLGLAITKQYCELLGGTIAVQSEINKGSTFTVRLPLNASLDKVKAVA
ncbi:MAG: ATP-binding protein [Gammaproteobacteria bacterium]|nr:ATP-binding protein [Gammaproteobacteria bacterium]